MLFVAAQEDDTSGCYFNDLTLLSKAALEQELFNAIRSGKEERVKRALENGANPNALHPQNDETPLTIACELRSSKIIKLLLNAGANPNPEEIHVQPLCRAIYSITAVKLLLDKGAEVNRLNHFDENTKNGNTALHQAAIMGCQETVRMLLNNRASPYVRNGSGHTPLGMVLETINNAYVLGNGVIPKLTVQKLACISSDLKNYMHI
jgi:hypothetical protein